MHPLLQALFSAWDWRFDVSVVLLTFATLYAMGWVRLRKRNPHSNLAKKRRLAAYFSGLATLAIALMSPIDALGGQLLFMHMIQHKLEIMIAAPLLCLSNPFPFLVWGMPAMARRWIAPFFTQRSPVRSALAALMNPGLIWFLFIAVYMGWHDPTFYNYALLHAWVHDIQHLSFFLAAMLFWWHIVGAAPHLRGYGGVWGRLAMLVGVIPAQMIAGIIIATASHIIYAYYESVPRFWGISTLHDQAIAGAIMWIPSSEMVVWGVVFLLAGYFKREEKSTDRTTIQRPKSDVLAAP